MKREPSIFYLTPDYDVPSWGIGLLYHHVRILREQNVSAHVLHHQTPFRLSWLDVDVPIRYLDDASLELQPDDLLVVPEVLAHSPEHLPRHCRKVVFVQGSLLVVAAAGRAVDYQELGYEAAMAVLPHVQDIVATHFGIQPALVPPFIAPYFFADKRALHASRVKQVLLVGRPQYREAGYLDYDIVVKLLDRFLERRTATRATSSWQLIPVEGLSHEETAELMKQSALLVNLNTLEAFNTTVPEAMAAGCIVSCYEAFGGRDFLADRENAFVFSNNDVYSLVEGLFSLIDGYDERREELSAVRRAAHATATRYCEEGTARALRLFFEGLR